MKKNAMLKIAAILMVAVLLTTCAISSTFAKYVTGPSNYTDTARVAKWGLTFVTETDGLFLTSYENTSSVETVAADTKVVAPGTSGSASITTDFTGTPEVDFELITTATVALSDGWEDENRTFYCPLVFTIGSAEPIDGATYDSKTALVGAIQTAVNNAVARQTFSAGTFVDTTDGTTCAISWEWPFEVGDDADEIAENDAHDTALGNAAAVAAVGAELTISITINQTAQQID